MVGGKGGRRSMREKCETPFNVPSFFIRSEVAIRRKWTKISSLRLFPPNFVSFVFSVPSLRVTFAREKLFIYRNVKFQGRKGSRLSSKFNKIGIKIKSRRSLYIYIYVL